MSKKVLFIGDIHGRSGWRELALEAMKNFYEVVFLGDYVDSFDISAALQLDNLKAFIAFLRKKGGHALIGNHDYAYIYGFSQISGYQHPHAHSYRQLFIENMDLFHVAWGYKSDNNKYTLATHAGLTYRYWNQYVLPLFEEGEFLNTIIGKEGLAELEIHEILNYLKDKKDLLWKVGARRGGYGTPSPIWADYHELIEDSYPEINQVFGHTAKFSPSLDMKNDNFHVCLDAWGGKKNNKPPSLVISL